MSGTAAAKSSTKDTKERILDAAERLFADRGFAATSMRTLTQAADVNLAAVNYHFGSKERLIRAVFSRRLRPLNEERLAKLERAVARPSGEEALRGIVEAFIGPPLRMSRNAEGAVFMRLLGHAMNQPKDAVRQLLGEQFREVLDRFTAAIRQALPQLPEREIRLRLLFMAGAMAHTMCLSDELRRMYDGAAECENAEAMVERLVPFLCAGLRAASHAGPAEES
jgi:AcrR family transcriptional regulator